MDVLELTGTPSTSTLRESTVAVVGLGDLGGRVVSALARLPVGRVVAVGRGETRTAQVAGQAAIVARLLDGASHVTRGHADVADVEATARELRRLQPDVVVAAAAAHTWWRTPEAAADLPYGAWLPLQVPLVRDLVRARDEAGLSAPVVALPYPDAVGPVLAPQGLAPEVGAGNVAEVAAKLEVLAAERAGCEPDEVEVRVVAHHAAERLAFGAFSGLGGAAGSVAAGTPPVRADVSVRGVPLDRQDARELFQAAYPLLAGRETHVMTAAATAATVLGLLGDEPRRLHVPAPAGRPGGYPVRASRAGVELDLAPGCSEAEAVAVNAVAARWDGIERIGPDGTITFTDAVVSASRAVLGWTLDRVEPDDLDAVAAELEAHLRAGAA
jgi:hypothetical protein